MQRLNRTLLPKSPTIKNLILVSRLFFGITEAWLVVGGNNPKDPSLDYAYLKLFRL